MANVERRIEGFGHFSYDQAVYDELMRLNKAELTERELEGTIYQRTAVRGLKKADLVVLVAHHETARREWDANVNRDQSVNESIDGAEVMTRWLALPEDQRGSTVESQCDKLAATPSPERHYQSAMEALAVLETHLAHEGDHRDGCECADCEEFYVEGWDDPSGGIAAPDDLGQRVNNEDELREEYQGYTAPDDEITVDPEFAAEVDSLIARDLAADLPPATAFVSMPITETDVSAAEVMGLAQLGKRVVWAKLISVVNRRTRFAPAFLVTVEVEGIRRLIKADHYLAA